MKILEHTLRHGEVYFDLVDEIPDLETKKPYMHDGRPIVGHSESGHHHVIDGSCAQVFDFDEFTSFLEAKKTCKVIHLKTTNDRHGDGTLAPGKYLITRQREYTPEGFRRARD